MLVFDAIVCFCPKCDTPKFFPANQPLPSKTSCVNAGFQRRDFSSNSRIILECLEEYAPVAGSREQIQRLHRIKTPSEIVAEQAPFLEPLTIRRSIAELN